MNVKIIIEISKTELNNYIESYKECNYNENPELTQIKNSYIDYFIANKNDFIDPSQITVYFK